VAVICVARGIRLSGRGEVAMFNTQRSALIGSAVINAGGLHGRARDEMFRFCVCVCVCV